MKNALDRRLPPLPDLVPIRVQPTVNVTQTAFDASATIINQGGGSATGPFKVTLAVTYVDYSQDPPLYVTPVADLNVPADVTINPGAIYTASDSLKGIPINYRPGSSEEPVFDLYLLVDSEEQIEETDESNNALTLYTQTLPF